MSLKVNEIAPNFKLFNQDDDLVEFNNIKNKTILFFYPKDNTPGCTKEAIGFSENLEKINSFGYSVFGISKDTTKKHKNFVEKYNLTVQLLSDFEQDTCEKYGVWVEKSMYGKKYFGIERSTFLIDKYKKIIHVWNKVKVANHLQEVIALLNK
tara:strand:+ start:1092 stop:1550 length:459 start_codon:yes stop_codon:yes gene_type:complete